MNTAPETTLRFVYARKGSDLNQLRLIGSYPFYNSFHRIGFNIFLVGYRQHFGCLTMAIYQSWFISHHIEHFVGYVPILNLLVIFDFLDWGQHPFIYCLHVFFQDLSIEPLFIQNLSHFSYHMSIIISIFFLFLYLPVPTNHISQYRSRSKGPCRNCLLPRPLIITPWDSAKVLVF